MERLLLYMEMIKNPDPKRIKSLDKALNILEFLSNNEQEIGISGISTNIGMALSTVHRILHTLKSRGYVIQNHKTAKYRLGIKLFELGCEVQNSKNLIQIFKPYMIGLSALTNETVNLAILEGRDIVYLDTIESSETLHTGIAPGTRTIAHCTALGKALLAHLSNEDLEQLYGNEGNFASLTLQSISSLTVLRNELIKIKKSGYALDLEESIEGINCIGAPVLNRQGESIAAISIAGPASRLTLDKIDDIRDNLITVSQEITTLF